MQFAFITRICFDIKSIKNKKYKCILHKNLANNILMLSTYIALQQEACTKKLI